MPTNRQYLRHYAFLLLLFIVCDIQQREIVNPIFLAGIVSLWLLNNAVNPKLFTKYFTIKYPLTSRNPLSVFADTGVLENCDCTPSCHFLPYAPLLSVGVDI